MMLLLDGTIRISVLVLLGLAGATLLRRRSAALRHWVIAVAVVCAAATPALGSLLPPWRLPLEALDAVAPRYGPADEIAVTLDRPGEVVVNTVRAPQTPRPSWGDLLAAAWIAGGIVNVAMLFLGIGRLVSLGSRSLERPPAKWVRLAANLSEEYRLRRRVRLVQAAHPALLVTWGIVRPTIILPAGCDAWTEDRARVVLCHELAHIRRGDWAVQMGAELLRSFYWFNPLLWMVCSRLRRESEQACDDLVLAAGVRGSDYAAHLYELARAFTRSRPGWLPAPAITGASRLERRIAAMLNARLDHSPLTQVARLAAATAMLVAAIPIAALGSAQTFAAIAGTIVDQNGGVIPDARLTLSHLESRAKHEVRSDASGNFQFVGLPAGEYAFEAEFGGFTPFRDRLTLATGQTRRLDVRLQVGSLQETIAVSDGPTAGPSRRSATASNDPEPCTPSAVGGRILPPRKIFDVRPQYPPNLRGASVDGRVVLEARIGTDGFVKDVRTASADDPDLDGAARDAVGQWRFTPTLLNCTPVEVSMMVRVYFKPE